jgi:hypothetical protein
MIALPASRTLEFGVVETLYLDLPGTHIDDAMIACHGLFLLYGRHHRSRLCRCRRCRWRLRSWEWAYLMVIRSSGVYLTPAKI